MEIIERFIESYNRYLETKNQIFNDVEFIKRIRPFQKELNEIENLYHAYKITRKYNLPEFYFLDCVMYDPNEEKIHFATHMISNMLYVYDIKSGIVFLMDEETLSLEWYCSENVINFFESMIIVLNFMKQCRGKGYDNLRKDYIRSLLDKCLIINGNKYDYYPFYSHIFAVD
jgi:hypothetical protein